jgi:protein-tyrosine-phosphatase
MVGSVKRILFLCTGNTCRSPMAEALFRAKMPGSWHRIFELTSAGTSAWEGQPASTTAIDALNEIGVDLSKHSAKRLNAELVDASDLIVAMESTHSEAVRAIKPDAVKKVILLGALDQQRAETGIADPIGGDRCVYTESRDEIERLVLLLIEYVAGKYDLRT